MVHLEIVFRQPCTPAHNLGIVALVQEAEVLVVGLNHKRMAQQQRVPMGDRFDNSERFLLEGGPSPLRRTERMGHERDRSILTVHHLVEHGSRP
ncbi:MAG: hypothetical protein EBU88_15905, partial [Acidobacteria bacterium]|nr:hypothetical protein [Acidobacteriota bacterium]